MTTPTRTDPAHDALQRALAPVREALCADAGRDAEQILATARQAVEHDLAQAQQEVDDAVRAARRRGEIAARSRAAQAESRRRSDAHHQLLAEREAVRQRFTRETEAAFAELPDDPRYPALLDALEERARAQLGDGAEIARDPQPDGGVIGTAGSLRVDYSLPALARRAAAALEAEVAERCR